MLLILSSFYMLNLFTWTFREIACVISCLPRHLISDAHEWINEIPNVPIYYLTNPQTREEACNIISGKENLVDDRGIA